MDYWNYGLPDTTYQRDYGVWNAQEWLEYFKKYTDKHQARKEVFASTIQAVQRQNYISESGKTVSLIPNPQLVSGTKLYAEELYPDNPSQTYDTEIVVENEDCLAAAERYVRSGSGNVAVLNMASRQTPGGGVYTGAGAQEESCFRRSNYYLSLYQFADFAHQYHVKRSPVGYPLDRNFGGCFSPGVTVFRDVEERGYAFIDDPWEVSFIAVPALNRPKTVRNQSGEIRITDSLIPAAKNKIRTIFNIAIDNQIDILVLGAHGCGAFKNPPGHIAELFREILSEPAYKNRFKKISFAIIGNNENFSVFSSVFSMDTKNSDCPESGANTSEPSCP